MLRADAPEVIERVYQYSDLVDLIARQVAREIRGLDRTELKSFGNHGLLDAARKFDPDRGVLFRTYASIRIRGAMIDGIRSLGPLPRRAWQHLRALEAANAVAEGMEEDSSALVVSNLHGQPADDFIAGQLAAMATAMALRMETDTLRDTSQPTPEDAAEHNELASLVHAAVATLPDPDAAFVRRHFFHGHKLDDIAADLGLSKSWGSRILARAMKTLSRRLADAA